MPKDITLRADDRTLTRDEYAAELLTHMPAGWQATTGEWACAISLTHPTDGQINVSVRNGGTKVNLFWHRPNYHPDDGETPRIEIGSDLASGPKNLAAQIQARILPNVGDETLKADIARGHRDKAHSEAATIIHTLSETLDVETREEGRFLSTTSVKTRHAYPRMSAYLPRGERGIHTNPAEIVAEARTPVGGGESTVHMELRYISPEDAQAVAELLNRRHQAA